MFQFRQGGFQLVQFLGRQRRQVGIIQRRHLFQLRHRQARLVQAGHRVKDRLQFGVFLGQLDDLSAIGRRFHARFDHAEAVHNLGKLGVGEVYQCLKLSKNNAAPA